MWGEQQVAYLGDSGEHVTELQQRLAETGFACEATGNFDQQTQDALNAFGQSQSVSTGANADAIIALQSATGGLQHDVWTSQLAGRAPEAYGYTADVRAKYQGEEVQGNTVWTGQERAQTYYPDDQTAADDYGVQVSQGRVVFPGEVDGAGNPVYLDTTEATGGVGLVGTKPERMIYTMGPDGEMRAADAHAEQDQRPGQRFHHTSLTGGDTVAAAGEMKVREGVVEAVSDRSGHYAPDFGMTQQVGQHLAAQGVDTSQVTFELGNYTADGVQQRPDTLASGAEVEAYDPASTLAQLQRECAERAERSGQQKWTGAWALLPDHVRKAELATFYAELWEPIAAAGERGLFVEARRMLEERHQQQRTMLAGIAGAPGWREDPFDTSRYRWYDGTAWTSTISGHDADGHDIAIDDPETQDIFLPRIEDREQRAAVHDQVAQQQAAAQQAAAQQAAAQQAAAQQAAAQQAAAQQGAQPGPAQGGYIG